MDFYATSPTAITRLLEKHQIPRMPIWEIMAGEGNLEKPLEAAGYTVITSDIVERREKLDYVEDFFTTTELRAPIILTNPAYSIAMETVLHSIELGAEYIYMFLKTTFLEGQKDTNNYFLYIRLRKFGFSVEENSVQLIMTKENFKNQVQHLILGLYGKKVLGEIQRCIGFKEV